MQQQPLPPVGGTFTNLQQPGAAAPAPTQPLLPAPAPMQKNMKLILIGVLCRDDTPLSVAMSLVNRFWCSSSFCSFGGSPRDPRKTPPQRAAATLLPPPSPEPPQSKLQYRRPLQHPQHRLPRKCPHHPPSKPHPLLPKPHPLLPKPQCPLLLLPLVPKPQPACRLREWS